MLFAIGQMIGPVLGVEFIAEYNLRTGVVSSSIVIAFSVVCAIEYGIVQRLRMRKPKHILNISCLVCIEQILRGWCMRDGSSCYFV